MNQLRKHGIGYRDEEKVGAWERVWGLTWPCKSEGNELEVSMDTGLGRVVRKRVWRVEEREKVVMGTWCGVEREKVVRGMWCGVEREKVVRKKTRELGIEGERWTGEGWVVSESVHGGWPCMLDRDGYVLMNGNRGGWPCMHDSHACRWGGFGIAMEMSMAWVWWAAGYARFHACMSEE
ncbi:hypothetical protein CK203_093832 [Vitis vinifera]|uniref:Uncharacterized protein n=1 Tax=Vitis vinifera TaxID=29760 RepID=A0A438EQK2_VITVI|nr:hypothetical protein CK203_093832 [Vitis vinifera]